MDWAKLQALLTRITFCKQLGFWHVITKSNSKMVVGWITKNLCSARNLGTTGMNFKQCSKRSNSQLTIFSKKVIR